MAKGNIRLYDTEAEYLLEKDSFELPNVSFVEDSKVVFYNAKLSNPWATIANGVYAVGADGSPVMVEDADESCTAVALVVGEHKFMIEKNETDNVAYNGNEHLYWENNNTDLSLMNYTNADGTNRFGCLPRPDGSYLSTPNLSGDYTAWTSGALSDFNGKDNTDVIVAASADEQDMGTILKNFNATEVAANRAGDWYIPACGQLALMYLNMTTINEALTKIEGTVIRVNSDECYWSSSEYSSNAAWGVAFGRCEVRYFNKDYSLSRVRFVRDLI
jgi:hypothetical protein